MPAAWPDRGGHLWPKAREVRRDDGTVVRYAAHGPLDAPPVVCCAGFLCPDNFWRDLGPDLARDHRVVVLNYRGVGASSEAGGGHLPPRPGAYTVPDLAGDVAAVMDAESTGPATVIGHSMGAQVALALWRARPELVGGIALLSGHAGSPFHTFYDTRTAARMFPLLSMVVPALPRRVAAVPMRALELPVMMPVARAIRALGPHTPSEGMYDYRQHLGRIDPRTAIWTARGMHAFDGTRWLTEVDVPTLVAVGDADAWTPPSLGQRMAELLPQGRLLVLPGGSHALPIEFPAQLLTHIRALTRRAVAR